MTSKSVCDLARLFLGDPAKTRWEDLRDMVPAVNSMRRELLKWRSDWQIDANGAVRTHTDAAAIDASTTVNLPDDALTPGAHYIASFCFGLQGGAGSNRELATYHFNMAFALAKGLAAPTAAPQ
jgi:hypothetical protein